VNEKKYLLFIICVSVIGFIIGYAGARFTVRGLYGGRSPGDVDRLAIRYDQLNREYTERQQIINEQQRSITDSVNECLGYVEIAGEINQRTGENASRAIGNLTEAINFIRQGIAEREALKNELNNIRSALYRIRDDNREYNFLTKSFPE